MKVLFILEKRYHVRNVVELYQIKTIYKDIFRMFISKLENTVVISVKNSFFLEESIGYAQRKNS